MEIQREVLVQKTRLLGAEHEGTLTAANKLAMPLPRCGRGAEAGQLLRETLTRTLALSRRTLGPSHELTEALREKIRSFGLASRRTTWVGYELFTVGIATPRLPPSRLRDTLFY